MPFIETERLLLRPAHESDLGAIHAILSDARAMAYWSTAPYQTVEQSRDWLAAMIATDPELGEDFIIEHEGRVIGKAGCYRFPDVGYILHPDSWGRGFAREALSAAISRAFAIHCLPSLRADVDPRNGASLKLLQRLGFRETSREKNTWHVAGEWCDSVYLALDRGDWLV